MELDWDKKMTAKLVELGIEWEKARIVVGLIAEERQTADHIGYIRGYNEGYANAEKKLTPISLTGVENVESLRG